MYDRLITSRKILNENAGIVIVMKYNVTKHTQILWFVFGNFYTSQQIMALFELA